MSDEYEFIVRGAAGPATRAAFAEFAFEIGTDRTVLRGAVRDQAALFGVLDRMRDVGLELLEVRHTEEQ